MPQLSRRGLPHSISLWLAFAALGLVLTFGAGYWANRLALDRLAATGNEKLEQIVGKLRADLAQYEILPRLLAEDAAIAAFLANPNDASANDAINGKLTHLNEVIGALDTYLLDARGTTLAASNWQHPVTFIGRNFAFRPYYQDAIAGQSARYFALGTTSNTRGYYFAHPVDGPDRPLGVIVVKATVDDLEASWADSTDTVLVVDDYGVVFLSSNPAWLFQSMRPLEARVEQRLRESKRYSELEIATMPVNGWRGRSQDSDLLELPANRTSGAAARSSAHLYQSSIMPRANWRVVLLQPIEQTVAAKWLTMLLVGMLMLSLGLVGAFLLERQRRIRQGIAHERRVREVLESEVLERTRELSLTHQRLRRAQGELLRAERFAALGQLSAGLSHEIAQPLTAIHSYVNNARALIDRHQLSEAQAQLDVVDDLTDRMTGIVRNLKTLARAEQIPKAPIVLNEIIGEVLELLDDRIHAGGARVHWDANSASVTVLAAALPAQQILLNVLINALDAVDGRGDAQVWISVDHIGNSGALTIRDNGPGLSDVQLRSMFEPFFTTKQVGYGLGLGLAVAKRMIDAFGGDIEVGNSERGGAVITVHLPLANTAVQSLDAATAS